MTLAEEQSNPAMGANQMPERRSLKAWNKPSLTELDLQSTESSFRPVATPDSTGQSEDAAPPSGS